MFVSVDGSHPDVLNSLADISENLILFALKKHKQSLEDRFRYLGYKIPKNINIVYLDSYLSYFNIKSDLKIDFIVANCPLSGFFAYLYKSSSKVILKFNYSKYLGKLTCIKLNNFERLKSRRGTILGLLKITP